MRLPYPRAGRTRGKRRVGLPQLLGLLVNLVYGGLAFMDSSGLLWCRGLGQLLVLLGEVRTCLPHLVPCRGHRELRVFGPQLLGEAVDLLENLGLVGERRRSSASRHC